VLPGEVERFIEIAEYIKTEMESAKTAKLFPIRTLAEMIIYSRKRSIGDESPLPVNMQKMREESRIVTGIHDIYGSLYDEIGFSKVFKTCPVSSSVMRDIVMARLAKPCSKRSSAELAGKRFWHNHSLRKDLSHDGYFNGRKE
jgi:hypothetical protein